MAPLIDYQCIVMLGALPRTIDTISKECEKRHPYKYEHVSLRPLIVMPLVFLFVVKHDEKCKEYMGDTSANQEPLVHLHIVKSNPLLDSSITVC